MKTLNRREKRKRHIRKHVNGTDIKPRIYVYKSNKYINSGVANDQTGKVLFGNMQDRNAAGAKKLGEEIAKLLKSKKIETAVFDRSGYKYHGILVAFVDTLREKGIKI